MKVVRFFVPGVAVDIVIPPPGLEIVNAVGGKIDIICDGGIKRGTHILKAISKGANACSGGRLYLYALASGGEEGVTKSIDNLRGELIRNMKLMGLTKISQLSKENLRF